MPRALTFCLLALSLPLLGCGSKANVDRPAVVQVTGTVTYQQQPVEGATVLFSPADQTGYGATGLTDREGKFTLRTFDPGDGAVPGDYKVTVAKFDMSTANPDLEDDLASELRNDAGDDLVGPTSLLPVRYSEVGSSGLDAKVSASDQNVFAFDLND